MLHIEIWNAKRDSNFIFMDFDFASSKVDLTQYTTLYNKVYEFDTDEYHGLSTSTILNKLYQKFNIDHPEDFRGHSMSVSDIVTLDGVPYYCDSFGFKEV